MTKPSNNPVQSLLIRLGEYQLKFNHIFPRESKGATTNLGTEGCNLYFSVLADVKQTATS